MGKGKGSKPNVKKANNFEDNNQHLLNRFASSSSACKGGFLCTYMYVLWDEYLSEGAKRKE